MHGLIVTILQEIQSLDKEINFIVRLTFWFNYKGFIIFSDFLQRFLAPPCVNNNNNKTYLYIHLVSELEKGTGNLLIFFPTRGLLKKYNSSAGMRMRTFFYYNVTIAGEKIISYFSLWEYDSA